MADYADAVNALYSTGDLVRRVLDALKTAGVDVDNLTVDDLRPIDELHIAGRRHTLRLGRMAGVSQGMRVIDVGCGIGGPARALAHHFGCKVTGVDLTEEFCCVGRMLTERTGLDLDVEIRHADALDLPFDRDTFDLAWMQHTALNVPDKAKLFTEIRRVLRPNGKIALYEILLGSQPVLHFPLPWAQDASLNLLVSEEELLHGLSLAGFVPDIWEVITDESTAYLGEALGRPAERHRSRLSPSVIRGPEFSVMIRNVLRNLREDRLRVIQAVLRSA